MVTKAFPVFSPPAYKALETIVFLNPTIHAKDPDMQQKAKDAVQHLFDENPSLAGRRADTAIIM
jgi:hypothetical protein